MFGKCGKAVVKWKSLLKYYNFSLLKQAFFLVFNQFQNIFSSITLQAASWSGNYDLNGQRSASRCWPSVVAQQRLNRPRLKVCDSLLLTIHLLAHTLAYAAYTAQYRLHSRFVRICLPFTYSLYYFFGALLLEISTVPIRSKFKNRFPNASACFSQNRWLLIILIFDPFPNNSP